MKDQTFVLDSAVVQSGENDIIAFMLTNNGSLHQLLIHLTEKRVDNVNFTEQYVSDVPCFLRKYKNNVLVLILNIWWP